MFSDILNHKTKFFFTWLKAKSGELFVREWLDCMELCLGTGDEPAESW